MCGFTVDLIDFDELSDTQKKTLLKKLQKKRKALQTQLKDVNQSLVGIDRALEPLQRGAAVGRLRRAVATALDRRGVIRPGETVVVICNPERPRSSVICRCADYEFVVP